MPSPTYVLNSLSVLIGAVGGWVCAAHFGQGMVGAVPFLAVVVALVEMWPIRRRRDGARPAAIVVVITAILVALSALAAKGLLPELLIWAGAAGFVVSWGYVLIVRVRLGFKSATSPQRSPVE